MRSHRFSVVALSFALAPMLAITACSSSTKATTSPSSAGAGATSSGSGAPTTAKPSTNVAMPKSGCLLTDAQASALVNSPLTGTSTNMPENGLFCAYQGDSGDAGVSVSVKPYPDSSGAKAIVNGLLTNTAKLYVNPKKIDVGDGGAVASVGQGAQSFSYARFTEGDVFVEITVRPGDEAAAEKGAKQAAAAF